MYVYITFHCIRFLIVRPETNSHYDPEEMLSRSIRKDKIVEQGSKGNPRDPRRKKTPERNRSRSSFSERYIVFLILIAAPGVRKLSHNNFTN